MRKLLNRPAFALCAVLALIFLIILFKYYCKLIDQLTISLSQNEESVTNIVTEHEEMHISTQLKYTKSEFIEPQLPSQFNDLKASIPKRQITFGYLRILMRP